jgi:hypothetical protein
MHQFPSSYRKRELYACVLAPPEQFRFPRKMTSQKPRPATPVTRRRQAVSCPNCKSRRSDLLDVRPLPDGSVRRLRECFSCGTVFTSAERAEDIYPKRYLRDQLTTR